MSGTDLKTVADEAQERANEAIVDLRIAEMFGDMRGVRAAQRRGLEAALDLANALRAGAPMPEGLPEDGLEDFLSDYPEGSTVESLLEAVMRIELLAEMDDETEED